MSEGMWTKANLALWHELTVIARMSIMLDRIRELLDEMEDPPPALSASYWYAMDKWNDEYEGFLKECSAGMVSNGTIQFYEHWRGLNQDLQPKLDPTGDAEGFGGKDG